MIHAGRQILGGVLNSVKLRERRRDSGKGEVDGQVEGAPDEQFKRQSDITQARFGGRWVRVESNRLVFEAWGSS